MGERVGSRRDLHHELAEYSNSGRSFEGPEPKSGRLRSAELPSEITQSGRWLARATSWKSLSWILFPQTGTSNWNALSGQMPD